MATNNSLNLELPCVSIYKWIYSSTSRLVPVGDYNEITWGQYAHLYIHISGAHDLPL
jgi:hypothetical protein